MASWRLRLMAGGNILRKDTCLATKTTWGHIAVLAIFYNQAGEVIDIIQEFPSVLAGDSATETRLIYLNIYKLADTLVVNHWFRNFAGKPVGKDFWSF